MKRPNVLFICTDQQSALAMSNAGTAGIATPHIDALAISGVTFRNAFCTYPLCSPSRASHFTGLMPHQAGVSRNAVPVSTGLPVTMGSVFSAAVYNTVWAGKWHLPEAFPPHLATVPGFHAVPLKPGPDERRDRLYTDEAIRFLQVDHDRPFFLSLQLHDPHEICSLFHTDIPPWDFPDEADLPPLPDNHEATTDEPDVIGAFRIEETKRYEKVHRWDELDWSIFRYLRRRYRDGDAEAGQLLQGMRDGRWIDLDWRRYRYVYYLFVERADRQIGRVMAALKASGLEDNTIVLYTSDHGDGMGAHRWTRKLTFYEESVRVPLAVSWKGVIPPGVEDRQHLVSGVDLLPTLCDYAAIELDETLPGRSIRPLIEHPESPGREYVVAELASIPSIIDSRWSGRMLRTKEHKYVVFDQGDNNEMLFDIARDPLETVNLAQDPACEAVRDQLRECLQHWCLQTSDDFAGCRTYPAQRECKE